MAGAKAERSTWWSIVSVVRKAKEKAGKATGFDHGRLPRACETTSAISFIRVEGRESGFVILRKAADGVTVKASEYVSCPEKSVTGRREKVPVKTIGETCVYFGRGEGARYGTHKKRE